MKNDFTIREQFLQKYDFWFSQRAKYLKKQIYERNKKLNKFLSFFTIEKIKNMSIKDYAVGAKTNDSFCWWVENNLHDLGEIRGGQLTAYQKFGIYFDKDKNDYSFGNKKTKKTRFGTNNKEIFENIKNEIIFLLNDAKHNNLEGIEKNKLNPLFKNKLTYLYNCYNWLPIYSDNDLNILLTVLSIPFSTSVDRVYKRKLLFDFYKSLNRSDISPLTFMDFVYDDLGFRSFLRSSEANEFHQDFLSKDYVLIDVKNVNELLENNCNKHGLVSISNSSVLENKIVGKAGEQIVKKYLNNHKAELGIIGDIDCPCEYDDSKHYDFCYKNKDGITIYIESKATKLDRKENIIFEMSGFEYNFMNKNKKNYYVFYVNDVFNGTEIKAIPGNLIIVNPSKYLISLKAF